MKVLCFGSINIDYTYQVKHFVKKGETISSDAFHIFSGGKGLNQAIALSNAGADTYFAGSVGEDGIFVLKQLEAARVNIQNIRVLGQEKTGHAIIQNDMEGDNCIILYGGANQKITKEQVDETISQFEKGDFIVLQNEINNLSYIMEKAKERGMVIILNPSPMDDSILHLPLEMVDYFLLNEGEAIQIAGMDLEDGISWTEIGGILKNRFSDATIILTLGEQGSIYFKGETVIEQPAYSVKVVDTTGAGDTFTGYFLGALTRGYIPKEAMKIASRASSIAVTRQGAAQSIPMWREVMDGLRE